MAIGGQLGLAGHAGVRGHAGQRAAPAACMLAGALLAGALLSGCASTAPRAALPLPVVPWEQRLSRLQSIQTFELDGKVAASDGHQGFSAGLRWRQQDDAATLDFSAPLGFGAAHVEAGPQGLSVTTAQGTVLTSSAASEELAATLGFEPPIGSLRYWVLGASDPAYPAQESIDEQQRLTHLEQDGWQVDCADYAVVGGQWLPRRLTLTRQVLHLKLVVNSWRL
jgi:outer membrane lipoprotein LolB